ncbi:hypothetical protein ABPG77_005150 [Micractinium sp. CCAP 211/92]
MADKPTDKYATVREALRRDDPLWVVEHCDITCDGCEQEPITGHRFKCCVCEDIDLCGACMRALVAARVKMSQEAGQLPAPRQQGGRPRRWVHKLRSKELSEKWAALQTAVPCLHPSHRFHKVVDGPERAVVFHPGSLDGPASSPAGGSLGSSVAALESSAAASSGSQACSSPDPGSSGGGDVSGSRLERFLATFPPSAASCSDVAWIVVSHPEGAASPAAAATAQPAEGSGRAGSPAARGDRGGGSAEPSLEERVDAAVDEWERLTASGRKPTAADVDALAAKHRILKGKWMLFARSGEEADAAWAVVARTVCGEPARATPLCRSAKVSSASPDGSWVICLYTDNYQDRADVDRVCECLRAALPPGLLQDKRLLYKPDILTHLGIYSRNEWQIKPTIAEARLA